MSLVMVGCAVIFLSLAAFWKLNAVLFMLAGGASMMAGLQWYDVYATDTGLGVSLMFIVYSFVCFSFAFRCLFWRRKETSE